ncbi:molybdopterin-dependent oxidoreductase [Sandarakinorhabdus sp. DWP1-3-1]|uniref:molybdopterin-dependent oxidoreductase n=1 Tax=Sandarakinorhabdus sp. DWP1-3-1 TaxID=2804627 RepID=UPI003CF26B79
MLSRRHLLAAATALPAARALAASTPPLTRAFPGKAEMILQRTTPALLETPLSAFQDIITPNDRFFVRWHWPFPTEIDPATFRLRVDGHVTRPLDLSLAALKRLPRFEITAVNQCSGNSRALFSPRIAGAQWTHGAMGNARWTGVRLRDVLDRAGAKPGAVQVRFSGLDEPVTPDAPDFRKSLAVDHARNGEVMIAWAMNGEALPILNGFPLRLVVPGWFSTYWVKMLDHIEVLDKPDDNYWMAKAYLVPDTLDGSIAPGTKDFAKRPISTMVPRAFITNVAEGARLPLAPTPVGGIAMGGDSGVARVEVSGDGGASWAEAKLGPDAGKYSFRRFDAVVTPTRGAAALMARCTNAAGKVQPMTGIWNPGGYLRGQVETTNVIFA